MNFLGSSELVTSVCVDQGMHQVSKNWQYYVKIVQ